MKRAPNFSVEEVDLLLRIIETQRSIVDCKKTDKLSTERKEKAWKFIAAEFNSRSGNAPSRNVYTLKKKHENLKKVLKRPLPQKSGGMDDDGGEKRSKRSIRIFEMDHKAGHADHKLTAMADHVHKNILTEADILKDEEISIPSDVPQSVQSTELLEDYRIMSDEEATVPKCKHDLTKSEERKSQVFVENGGNSKFTWAKFAMKKAKWTEEKLKTEIHILKKEHQQRMQFMQEKHDLEISILRNELTKSELYIPGSI